jgi:PKD repeat protein
MKKIFIISLGLIVSAAGFAQAKKKSPLDGRIYTITLTPEGEKKAEAIKDEASFALGKFKSTFLMQAGFPQADYDYEVDSTTASPVIKFTVESKNENQERFSWDGSMEGDNISGTAIIRKKGKIQHTYKITGNWKNKKKAKPQPKAPVSTVKTDSVKTEQ